MRWLADFVTDLLARFRTWQIRSCPLGLRPPAGTPVWYASSVSMLSIPGEIVAYPGMKAVTVRLYFESPLGTDTRIRTVGVERLSYRV